MLKYTEFCVSHLEVPGESCLCIYISGCPNRCVNCHYPELQSPDEGEPLAQYFDDIVALYRSQISCVCFMGEGECSNRSQKELMGYVEQIHADNLLSCLYSGRDCEIEKWMNEFDYIKIGSYQENLGPISERTTNQKLYMKTGLGYQNITSRFGVE